MNSETTRPSLNAFTAGIDWIWKAREIDGLASVSSLARTTSPSRAAASCSRTGPSARHGPHHSAQKSTTTGTSLDRSTTSRSKSCSVTSMTMRARVVSGRVAECTLHTGGVALSGEEAGEGAPVVLLHGLTATRRYVV